MRPQQEKKSVVAHVSPRVGGHAIHKPTIEIDRLGGDEIIRYEKKHIFSGYFSVCH